MYYDTGNTIIVISQKRKIKGDGYPAHTATDLLTLFHQPFDTLQNVPFQYVGEGLHAIPTLNTSQNYKIGYFPDNHLEL